MYSRMKYSFGKWREVWVDHVDLMIFMIWNDQLIFCVRFWNVSFFEIVPAGFDPVCLLPCGKYAKRYPAWWCGVRIKVNNSRALKLQVETVDLCVWEYAEGWGLGVDRTCVWLCLQGLHVEYPIGLGVLGVTNTRTNSRSWDVKDICESSEFDCKIKLLWKWS